MSTALETALEFQLQLEANRRNLSRNQLKKQRKKMKDMFQKAAGPSNSTVQPKSRRPGKRGRVSKAAAAATEAHDNSTQQLPESTAQGLGAPQGQGHMIADNNSSHNRETKNMAADQVLTTKPASQGSKKRRRHVEGVAGHAHHETELPTCKAVDEGLDESAARIKKKKKKKKSMEEPSSHHASTASALVVEPKDNNILSHASNSHSQARANNVHTRAEDSTMQAGSSTKAMEAPAEQGMVSDELCKHSKNRRKLVTSHTPTAGTRTTAEGGHPPHGKASNQLEMQTAGLEGPTQGEQVCGDQGATHMVRSEKPAVEVRHERDDQPGPVVTNAVKKMLHFVPRSCLMSSSTASAKSSQTAARSSTSATALNSNHPPASLQRLHTSAKEPGLNTQQQVLQASISSTTTIILPSSIHMGGDTHPGQPITATTTTTTTLSNSTVFPHASSSHPVIQAQTAVVVSVSQQAEEDVALGTEPVGHGNAENDRIGNQQGASTSGREDTAMGQQVALSRKKLRPAYVYGNYHRYYGYRLGNAVHQDPRLKVMDECWFKGKRCIDVGCNEGLVTLDMVTHFKCKSMLGVDIDAGLVAKACRHLSQLRTKLTEQLTKRQKTSPWISGMTMSELRGQVEAVSNTAFIHEEWVNSPGKKRSVDVVLCLSVTKWIHFHWGDEGVKKLFAKVAKVLTPGGVFVLEPQPWSSYVKTRKKPQMMNVPFQDISKLELRPDNFVEYLTTTHEMTLIKQVKPGDGAEGGFDRIIHVFQKNQS